MTLTELAPLTDAALPVAGFRAHLRLGTGFADSASQDAALAGFLRAAIGVIEGRTGKALVVRGFRLTVNQWRWPDSQALPLAPVVAVSSLTLFNAQGQGTAADPARWRLVADMARPRIVAAGSMLPTIPSNGRAEVTFDAGFAATWSGVPGDLAQAVFLLAAQLYEGRTGAVQDIAPPIVSLLARWQPVRLGGGR